MKIRYAAKTDVGMKRNHNEDYFSLIEDEQLFIVADGMGGHMGGEEASALAAATVAQHVVRDIYLPFLAGGEPDADWKPWQEVLAEAVAAANVAVRTAIPDSGTTLTCGLVVGNQLALAHVGDSRAYLIGENGLQHLTRDHSLVQRLQELGQLSAEEAATHPSRNMLYRAVGQGDLLEADLAAHTLPSVARLLLCSDGLWGVVPESDIFEIVREAVGQPALQAACQALIAEANRLGGPDNITAILVQINNQ